MALHNEALSVEPGPSARFKVRAYKVAQQVIKQNKDLESPASGDEIEGLPLTRHMRDKLQDYLGSRVETKQLQTFLKTELMSLAGLGPRAAQDLIQMGLKSLAQLKEPKWFKQLPEATQVHLLHQPESRIPHEHMVALEPYLTDFKEEVIMVGSYRRQRPYSSDFDIMIVSSNTNVLKEYRQHLEKLFLVWPYSEGPDKMSLIIRVPSLGWLQKNPKDRQPKGPTKKVLQTNGSTYKLDAFRCPPEEKWSMLLYSTGSKSFNIRMRARAKRLGYLLNQNGLYDQGKRLPISSEKGFFDILGMPYKEPQER